MNSALALDELSENTFRQLEARVVAAFSAADPTGDDDLHSITNLALLSREDNSALSNSVFEVKRRKILERDRNGEYIPACTRNVFLKYYTHAGAQQIHFWGPHDRAAYLDAMLDVLRPFLTPANEP